MPTEATDQAAPSILIVDDNPANLRLLANVLRDRGYKPRPVLSGELALEAARLSPPDLILLDITMPGMDGFAVCEHLRADANLKTIPILFISALTDTANKVKAFSVGGCDYITKPFQFEEVEARVRTQLDLQRQKRELQNSYEELKKLEALRDSLTHMVVHDMRGQLMAMMLSLEMLSPPANGGATYLERARAGVTTLVEMTTLMLDISRLEAKEMPLKKTQCELSAITSAVMESLATLAGSRQVTLSVSGAHTVECDNDLISRVLQNILTNAYKFTSPNGMIDICIRREGQTERVAIHDNGTGIPDDDQCRIFDKFQQAGSTSKKAPGTGLGLAFSKLAIEAHGGQVGVRSKVGEGSTFWFTLPA